MKPHDLVCLSGERCREEEERKERRGGMEAIRGEEKKGEDKGRRGEEKSEKQKGKRGGDKGRGDVWKGERERRGGGETLPLESPATVRKQPN